MEPKVVQVRKLFEARIVTRALDDPAFRQQLLKDPQAAIAKELGIDLPASMKFQVIEEPANTILLVVPAVQSADSELTEAQLEAVAGGSLWTAIKGLVGPSFEENCAAASKVTYAGGVRG